jgi:hypothetical protein
MVDTVQFVLSGYGEMPLFEPESMTGRKAYSIVVHGAGCAFQATIAKARLPGQNQFVVFSGRS